MITKKQRQHLDLMMAYGAPASIAFNFLKNTCNLSEKKANEVMQEYCNSQLASQPQKSWFQKLFCDY